MLYSMVMFNFSVFDRKNTLFKANLFQKNQNCLFKKKHDELRNSNMLNSMVILIFSILDWKYPFGENVVKKKTVCSR